MPPTAPEKRSFAVCRPAPPCASTSAAASAIVTASVYKGGLSERGVLCRVERLGFGRLVGGIVRCGRAGCSVGVGSNSVECAGLGLGDFDNISRDRRRVVGAQ